MGAFDWVVVGFCFSVGNSVFALVGALVWQFRKVWYE